ncbi:MAG: DUF6916 family protein [Pirellulaceae bacterium]
MNHPIDLFNSSLFRPRSGDTFFMRNDAQTVKMQLTEVEDLPPATRRPDLSIRQEPFSLIFKSDDASLEQGTWQVTHAEIETVEMFLVPVGFGEYQVIYN